MAYDEELADRIRALIGDRAGLTEQKMFGGLAFLIGGNMAVSASGQGGLLLGDEQLANIKNRFLKNKPPSERALFQGP